MENKIHALREEGNLRVLPENKSEYKREFLAGTTSFLAMAYIIAVNPSILSAAGMPAGAIVTATCISAVIGCLIMGFYAKLPFGGTHQGGDQKTLPHPHPAAGPPSDTCRSACVPPGTLPCPPDTVPSPDSAPGPYGW